MDGRRDIQEIVAQLRDRLRDTDNSAGFHDVVGALEPLFEGEDEALLAGATRYLEPIQSALAGIERARMVGLEKAIGSVPNPCLAISSGGIILAANLPARELIGTKGGLEQCGIARTGLMDFIARCRQPGRQIGLLAASGDRHGLFVGYWAEETCALILTLARWSWPAGLPEELRRVFGLTQREMEILDALMAGESLEVIARRDGRSLGTLRQQTKAIFAKVGARGQTQLIALIAATATAWRGAGRSQAIVATVPAEMRSEIIERDGRRIGVRRFGLKDGIPIVLVHGALFGAGDFESERLAANDAGLSVLAVERAGYGSTEVARGRSDFRDAVALDILSAMDHCGWDKSTVVAHDVGTAFAFRLAMQAGQRITGIVAAPPTPPMLDWGQTATMPRAHRLHAWIVQRAPKLLDLMIVLGIAHVHHSGASTLPELFFGGCDFDRKAWSQPEFEPGLAGVYRLIAAQKGRGFREDMLITNLDWSEDMQGMDIPVRLLHGAHSQTVSLAAVEDFAAHLPGNELYVISDAGHTLPVTHARLVFAHAADLARRSFST